MWDWKLFGEQTQWVKLDFFNFGEKNISVKYSIVCKAIWCVYIPFEFFPPFLPEMETQ